MLSNINSFSTAENLVLIHSGEDYFSRLERIILDSKFEIHIQIYIFENDTTGKKIIEALKEAASRNVKIYILIDGFGSFSFPLEKINELKQYGINIRFFAPLFSASSFYLGRRLHHKVVVVDSKIALIGGINIANKYRGTATKEPWLDYAVQINDAKIAASLSKLCLDIYFRKRRVNRKKIASVIYTSGETTVSVLQNDWLKRKTEIYKAYIKSIGSAKKEIIIVGSYFLPGRKLINTLKKASRNNVKIKLILSGISDLPMARRASCHFYSKLLGYNIELYEWENSILHGKAAVIDNNWTTIGSFNLNNLSSFASIEMNVAIDSSEFSNEFHLHLNQIMSQCERITPESLKLTDGLSSKFINWVSYWITRIIEIIITYLPHKRFRKLY
ncbi:MULTISPECIES: phospholipase D-like domain-containing protein [unclassified Flavobacterium]|jgi:cardiolipin synthase|uniref:phospholipase D-like domain-containing protein n=1 Tax=unclassified Flavobacterium TaxID=196869 RepID=UPI0025BA4EF5|nr:MULTISPECIES: phospholipase D-like domain-containing protein [unclassified Flavobacterium]